jgi:serine phosphatase RsbU (regulator of sigma subunit)
MTRTGTTMPSPGLRTAAATAGERPIRVLLVEDDPEDALLLRQAVADARLARFEWTEVETLADAIGRVRAQPLDVALVDLSLPDSRGLETFELLRGAALRLPIVILTGLDDERTGLEAVQSGAQDYLVKGTLDGSVVTRSIRFAIERVRREQAERDLCAREAEVLAAREIQQRLFPASPPTVPGFDLAGASFPADETGGDYYDFIPVPGGPLALVVGDVSGHGLGAAMLMSETRAYLRALMLSRDDVADILGLVNRALSSDTGDEAFVTLLLGRLDPQTRTLIYASAGHPPGYVLDSAGNVKKELWSTGLPLGVDSDSVFSAADAISLEPGDLVFLLTDGVIEAAADDKTLFGPQRALEVVCQNRARPARQIIESLYIAVREFQPMTRDDDVTALVVKVL